MVKVLVKQNVDIYAVISSQINNIDEWRNINLKKLLVLDTFKGNVSYIVNTARMKFYGRRKILKTFKSIEFDVIYIPMGHLWVNLINDLYPKTKVVCTIHHPITRVNTMVFNAEDRNIDRMIYRADELIILSEIFREYVKEHYHKSTNQIHYIPHGVFDYYSYIFDPAKNHYYDPKRVNFLFFGLITEYKGIDILAGAYKQLREERRDISLTIVGRGDFSKYEKLYEGVEDVEIINSWIEDKEVGNFFTGSNIVTILPYIDATQSGVLAIAMKFKSLVIGTNTGGLPEQIVDGERGYLVEPSDIDDLYRMMRYVTENINKQKPLIENAYNYISNLNWDKLSQRLWQVMDKDK